MSAPSVVLLACACFALGLALGALARRRDVPRPATARRTLAEELTSKAPQKLTEWAGAGVRARYHALAMPLALACARASAKALGQRWINEPPMAPTIDAIARGTSDLATRAWLDGACDVAASMMVTSQMPARVTEEWVRRSLMLTKNGYGEDESKAESIRRARDKALRTVRS